MRNLGLSYLLCAAGFFGIAGLHRFYLGKPISGILWLLTGGLFYIGTIYDLLTMPSQVDWANRRYLPVGRQVPALGPPPQAAYPPPQAWPPAAPSGYPPPPDADNPAEELETRVLKLARKHNGRLTTPIVAAELSVPMADADKTLTEIATAGHAEVDITDEGVVVYDFPALRV